MYGESQQTNEIFKQKIKLTASSKNILYNKYYPLQIKFKPGNRNYFIIQNYCKHGEVELYSSVFLKLHNANKCLCYYCNLELSYSIPTDNEILNLQKNFDDLYKKFRFNAKEKWMIMNYPKELSIIMYFSKHLKNIELAERIYLFKHNLKDPPVCLNCDNITHFNHSSLRYTSFCDSPKCTKNISTAELEIYNYLLLLDNSTQHKFYINKNEYDIIVKNKNLLIEFNGLYWHSENVQKDKNYHYKKWKIAINNNYHLFTIWEDDWENKKEIIKSMLNYKLNKTEKHISARNCNIKEVDYQTAKEFLIENHLQGNCVNSVRIGLFYKNKLVSLMTFGKRKISNKTQFELLRFANILNISIAGGASKLFKYFITNYHPTKIISYASLDFSEGNLYEILGFQKIGETGINYWWVKHKTKYHRSNFMKWKLIKNKEKVDKTGDDIMRENGYYKVWNIGNLKYEYVAEN